VRCRALPLPRVALYESWQRLRVPPVQLAAGRVDVIHATTIIVPPRTAPLVITVHDLAFLNDPSDFTAHGVAVFRRSLDLVRRHADLVLCSSTATMDDAALVGIDPARLRLVLLGVDDRPVEAAARDEVVALRGLERPFVLFNGTIEPRKNLQGLARALLEPELAGLDLVVAGPVGWGADTTPVLAPLAERVHLTGFVPDDELRALFAAAAVFCYPSRREGFGLPVLQAMVQGTPVVTSEGTSTAEVAGGAAVLVDPHRPADIARGITEALARRDELAGLGRARAAELTWARTAAQTLAAYRELAR
jgi:glycosyltransferase involved in cell wall biosynthesis